jgi:hypothetical protein
MTELCMYALWMLSIYVTGSSSCHNQATWRRLWASEAVWVSEGVWYEIFNFRFFHDSVFPGPMNITWGPLKIFANISREHRRQMKTILREECFSSYFVEMLMVCISTHIMIFCSMFTLKCERLSDTGDKLFPVLLMTINYYQCWCYRPCNCYRW